ncbi:hypothetical protein M8C21_000731 [Ambrosia artemisiifolia]|uniref:Uncharacterized protein n=1 Tax=Ambrosia artemisiifolia TaxID=4212 RepID=A0AAD5GI70_AMBAR|nr:hypothetical protein M8C21_000731 [Ambrosia artemisiifolia]
MSTDDQVVTMHRNRPPATANHRPFHHRRRDRLPTPPPSSSSAITHRRPNFIIELRSLSNDQNTYNRHEIVTLMGKFKSSPDDFFLYQTGVVAARFFYQQWSTVLQTVVYLWEVLLDGGLSFMPRLVQNLLVPSDTEELNSRLRVLFRGKILGLLEGESVKKLGKKLEEVIREISRLESLLRKPQRVVVHMELTNKRDGNVREKELIERRIGEFKSAMECMIDYLDGKVFDSSDVKVLVLKGAFNWSNIYWMIKRECRRLDDGLPIYADRKAILWQIHCQQGGCLDV